MNTIQTLTDIKGKKALVRVDYNVPMKGDKIVDTRRIEASYKTLDLLLKKGATPMLVSHQESGVSLRPVAAFLSKKYQIVFITNDLLDKRTDEILSEVPPKTIILFENIRNYEGEEKNTASFAKRLASFADFYINDAFSVSHRKHASVVGVAKYIPAYAGYNLQTELKEIDTITKKPKHPFLFILGGAKFSTKAPLVQKFIAEVDNVFIAGATVNSFYKEAGFAVGNSVVEEGVSKVVKPLLKNPKLLLPVDVVISRDGKKSNSSLEEIQSGDTIVDIGKRSVELIAEKIAQAKTIIWNGPTGWYERGFTSGTTKLAEAVLASSAKVLIGGGDTAAAIAQVIKKKGERKGVFISTGGGATLEYLAKGTLPGLDVLG